MAHFNCDTGQIVLTDEDRDSLKGAERPRIVTDFWGYILGGKKFDDTLPKPEKTNLLK